MCVNCRLGVQFVFLLCMCVYVLVYVCVCVRLWGQVMRQLTAKAPLFVEKTIWSYNNAVKIRFKMIKLNVDFPIFASQHKTWHFNAGQGKQQLYWLDTKTTGAPIIRVCTCVCVCVCVLLKLAEVLPRKSKPKTKDLFISYTKQNLEYQVNILLY